jgi:hypothetical protein
MNLVRSAPELAGGDAASSVSPINLSREEAAVVAILTWLPSASA